MNYISLGFNCNVALALRKCNLNNATNVFDWLVSHPKDILNILKENITEVLIDDPIFLDFSMGKQKYYITDNNKIRRVYDKKNNLIFSHDYDGTQKSIIDTKNKYKRRLIRLKNVLTENDKILFIFSGKSDYQDYINNSHSIISLEDKTDCKQYLFYLLEISKYLKKSFPKLNFHILAFNLFDEHKDFEKDNISYKYFGDCGGSVVGRGNMEKKIINFLNNLKNRSLEPIYNNLNKFCKSAF
tara:strand:+ start:52 stop:777 length:726 start_codon:yes stop_codon:yes gene_type:complete